MWPWLADWPTMVESRKVYVAHTVSTGRKQTMVIRRLQTAESSISQLKVVSKGNKAKYIKSN